MTTHAKVGQLTSVMVTVPITTSATKLVIAIALTTAVVIIIVVYKKNIHVKTSQYMTDSVLIITTVRAEREMELMGPVTAFHTANLTLVVARPCL